MRKISQEGKLRCESVRPFLGKRGHHGAVGLSWVLLARVRARDIDAGEMAARARRVHRPRAPAPNSNETSSLHFITTNLPALAIDTRHHVQLVASPPSARECARYRRAARSAPSIAEK